MLGASAVDATEAGAKAELRVLSWPTLLPPWGVPATFRCRTCGITAGKVGSVEGIGTAGMVGKQNDGC